MPNFGAQPKKLWMAGQPPHAQHHDSSPGARHMRTRGLGYTAGVKGPEELAPFGASRRQALMDDYKTTNYIHRWPYMRFAASRCLAMRSRCLARSRSARAASDSGSGSAAGAGAGATGAGAASS